MLNDVYQHIPELKICVRHSHVISVVSSLTGSLSSVDSLNSKAMNIFTQETVYIWPQFCFCLSLHGRSQDVELLG